MTNDPQTPVVLARFPSDAEASALVGELTANGLQASTTGGFTAGFRAEAPGDVQVLVREADVDKARKLLARFAQDNRQIDWDQVDVGSPEE